jgi:hypothetical protein
MGRHQQHYRIICIVWSGGKRTLGTESWDTFLPSSWLDRVDFPAFGEPTMATFRTLEVSGWSGSLINRDSCSPERQIRMTTVKRERQCKVKSWMRRGDSCQSSDIEDILWLWTLANARDRDTRIHRFWKVLELNIGVLWLPWCGGTEVGWWYPLSSCSATLPFASLFKNASDVIKQTGVKLSPFVRRLWAAMPGRHHHHHHQQLSSLQEGKQNDWF